MEGIPSRLRPPELPVRWLLAPIACSDPSYLSDGYSLRSRVPTRQHALIIRIPPQRVVEGLHPVVQPSAEKNLIFLHIYTYMYPYLGLVNISLVGFGARY